MTLKDWTPSLSTIGAAALAYFAVQFTRQAAVYILPCQLKRYNQSGTNWALVTGATDGIGFGFCEELCARGFNVILHGRSASKLDQRARELRAAYPDRKTGIIVLDVVGAGQAVNQVAAQVQAITDEHGGRLTVLVNNVGGETKPFTALDMLSFADAQATIDRNLGFLTHITRVLLPLLAGKGRSGLVLNVSSFSAYGLPFITVYSATKGYVDTFTRALEAECLARQYGVEVLGLRVGQVRTSGFAVGSGAFVPNGRMMAKAGLNRVGCGQVIVWGYFWHWIQGAAFDILPRWMLMKASSKKMSALKKETEELLKKS
ncbi:hypothetical protein N7462_006093 [Penicillium macrosclerotiorum]|uniref:uncharacterized protein n=1 Tax=Penicillium macrosclerotiorum TaxID=303699 RepID=UPI00254722E9|nr:uncharacterized protein N7462_006093 [Penicillium macrosclerotiorum]KAJ5682928.1 hypothetical protein N7462_006093 [Penicillium macrosclerotiorum]